MTKSTSPKISSNILVIDTATKRLTVAVNQFVDSWSSPNRHTETLVEHIDKLLTNAGLTPAKLIGIVLVSGPGSFTGLRVGATVANGIGFVQKIGVVGVNEFEIVAKLFPKLDWIVLDGGRGELFVRHLKSEATVLPIEKFGSQIKKGDRVYVDGPDLVAKIHGQLALAGTIYIGPIGLADRQNTLASIRVPRTYRQVLPMYLREANITMGGKLKMNRLRQRLRNGQESEPPSPEATERSRK